MKRLLAYLLLVLSFTFIFNVKADDIRDFEIEGMSIGDSALNYFSKSKLKDLRSKNYTKNKKYKKYCNPLKDSPYTEICFYTTDDQKFKIVSIAGFILYPNDIKACYKKQKKIDKELQALFKNSKREVFNYKHAGDTTGKTKERDIIYLLNSKDEAGTACIDYGKEYAKKVDAENHLQVFIDAYEYAYYLKNEAWQ